MYWTVVVVFVLPSDAEKIPAQRKRSANCTGQWKHADPIVGLIEGECSLCTTWIACSRCIDWALRALLDARQR